MPRPGVRRVKLRLEQRELDFGVSNAYLGWRTTFTRTERSVKMPDQRQK